MDKLAVNGDSIVLQPTGFLWQGWDGKLPLQGSNIITSEGKSVILEPDVMLAALKGMGKMYVAPPFATPGSVVNLQLTIIPPSLSLSVKIMGQAVVTAATMGTYTVTVIPAMNPQGVPDPLITKVGQWSVETTSQSSFVSGMPGVAPEEEHDAKGDGSADPTEGKEHWVGVTVEDTDGNPLANQAISLVLPSGETLARKLGDSGAVRVDGVSVDEAASEKTALVRLFFDPRLAPVNPNRRGFITVQIVDEVNGPFAERNVVLTLPDGTKRTQTLNELGRTRFEDVPLGAKCQLEIVPAQTQLEFTLQDEDGAPLAGKKFIVKDSTGTEIEGVLDDEGFASVTVAEGECEVSVDFESKAAADGDEDGAAEADEDAEGAEGGDESAAEDGAEGAEDEAAIVDSKKTKHVIDVKSALFRLESAVVMPEGEAPDESEHAALSMVGSFAIALRFNEENEGKKLFVAGHADTSGDSDSNVVLSAQRANLTLAVLSGDREQFVILADATHKIADYKQILSWCSSAFAQFFNCDPGKIDEQEFTGIEPLKRFQAQYNQNLAALGGSSEIDVDGSVGPQTWGAFFDVYQLGMADELGEDAAGLRALQAKLEFVDDGRKALGFGETQPAVGGADGQREQANRRAEILFFDAGEEPDLALAEVDPANSELYTDEYDPKPIAGSSAKKKAIFLQFTDDEGENLGELKYRLETDDGFVVEATSPTATVRHKLPSTSTKATLEMDGKKVEIALA